VFSTNQLLLHTPGTSYPVRWVTVHDTDVDGTDSFDANAAAKNAGATPFKRPENAQFLPGSGYRTFFFCPTGDTDATSGNVPELAARGVWGSIFRVDLRNNRNSGRISIFVLGDAAHASFDNLTFADLNTLLATEDRGDLLHGQLNTLDSVWAFSVRGHSAKRFIALGRDATSLAAGEDNEPTGLNVSNGSPFPFAQPGSDLNLLFARGFVTRQHGDNVVWEIVKRHD
jgi:secreted PhoX family phosphatase